MSDLSRGSSTGTSAPTRQASVAVVLDACFSGGKPQRARREPGPWSRSCARGKRHQCRGLTAAKRHHISTLLVPELGHGLMTYHLSSRPSRKGGRTSPTLSSTSSPASRTRPGARNVEQTPDLQPGGSRPGATLPVQALTAGRGRSCHRTEAILSPAREEARQTLRQGHADARRGGGSADADRAGGRAAQARQPSIVLVRNAASGLARRRIASRWRCGDPRGRRRRSRVLFGVGEAAAFSGDAARRCATAGWIRFRHVRAQVRTARPSARLPPQGRLRTTLGPRRCGSSTSRGTHRCSGRTASRIPPPLGRRRGQPTPIFRRRR